MIPTYFLAVAIALRLAGEAQYFVAVVGGRARPNPVSWFCWSLVPLVAFAAQTSDGVRPTEWMTLVLAIGPIGIVTAAMIRGVESRVTRFDLACGGLAFAGLGAWPLTSQPAATLWFSILADLVAAVPTFRNAYCRPYDECAPTYLLSTAAMAVTLLTVNQWEFGHVALPLYIMAVNAVLYGVIKIRATLTSPALSTVNRVWPHAEPIFPHGNARLTSLNH